MRLLLALVAVLVLGGAAPAWGQSSQDPPRREGGLHVSGGGVFGYIGGSGSPSGTIRGPGGGGSSGGAAVAPASEKGAEPSAVDGGVVTEVPAPSVEAKQAASGARLTPLTWVIVALMGAGVVWLFRKLPAPS